MANGEATGLAALGRREFLGRSARQAASVAAGVMALPVIASGATRDRLRCAVIGVRNRGRVLATELADLPDAELMAICDVDSGILQATAARLASTQGREPRQETDYRRLLDDPQLDAVVIATPDHWHAAMACQAMEAGKDVYLESPVSRTLGDGSALLTAASRHQRIVQCGIQERSGIAYQNAIEYVRSGQLGVVRMAKAWVVHRRRPMPWKADSAEPEGLDYRAWLGPAPQRPFNWNRCHFNWRWFWEYGGGELSQTGSHLLDVARWGLGVDWPERVWATGAHITAEDSGETPDTLNVQFAFGDRTILWEHRLWSGHAPEGRNAAVAFYGDRGTLIIDRSGWKVYDGNPAGETSSASSLDRAHLQDFLRSVRGRGTPQAPLMPSLVSAGLCHLGNAAYRSGREVRFDPQTGECRDNPVATRLLQQSSVSPPALA